MRVVTHRAHGVEATVRNLHATTTALDAVAIAKKKRTGTHAARWVRVHRGRRNADRQVASRGDAKAGGVTLSTRWGRRASRLDANETIGERWFGEARHNACKSDATTRASVLLGVVNSRLGVAQNASRETSVHFGGERFHFFRDNQRRNEMRLSRWFHTRN